MVALFYGASLWHFVQAVGRSFCRRRRTALIPSNISKLRSRTIFGRRPRASGSFHRQTRLLLACDDGRRSSHRCYGCGFGHQREAGQADFPHAAPLCLQRHSGHTYASRASMRGVSPTVVAKQLEHANTQMVEIHCGHLSDGSISIFRAALCRADGDAGNDFPDCRTNQ